MEIYKDYLFLKNYQNESKYRESFNKLTHNIFGISFEDWYKYGYWNEKYIPYTLFDRKNAIANVSVNVMPFNILGKQKKFIQIGTVATDERYRNQGLIRFLMEKVLDEWNEKCDLIYLYANKSVLEMYPKFGFNPVSEYEYFKSIKNYSSFQNTEKLNMHIKSNRDMVCDYAKNSVAIAKISMQENADLVMFYCLSFLKDNIFYLKSLDAIAIATFQNNEMRLWDVFSKAEIDLEQAINALTNSKIHEVVIGFTPNDISAYSMRKIDGSDTLFIQNEKTALFDENKLMFPLISHA